MIWIMLFAALLSTVTVWFLLRPLAQSAGVRHEGHHQLMQLRDRLLAQLRELDMEEGDANVDPKVAADERLRLEAELARALKELETHNSPLPPGEGQGVREPGQGDPLHPSSHPSPEGRVGVSSLMRVVIVTLAVLVPLGSAALYFGTNRLTLARLVQPQMQVAEPEQIPPQVQQMVARLEQRLAQQPNDAKGWAMLGRSYEVLGRAEEADKAYANAYRLTPNDVEVLAAYASFLASRNPSAPSAETVALFRKLYAIDPTHPAALWTLGLAAFHAQKFGEAQKHWERLLKQVPADSEVVPHIKRAIEQARAQAAKK